MITEMKLEISKLKCHKKMLINLAHNMHAHLLHFMPEKRTPVSEQMKKMIKEISEVLEIVEMKN